MIKRIEVEYTGLAGDPGLGFDDFTPTTTSMPEPSTLLLIVTGLGKLAELRRKFKSKFEQNS